MTSHLAVDRHSDRRSPRRRGARPATDRVRVVRHRHATPATCPGSASRPATVAAPVTAPVTASAHARSWPRELLLVGVLYLAYAGSRLASFVPADAATSNGHRVLDLERTLHIAPEHTLNDLLYSAPTWVSVAASYFYMSMHYVMTVVTLVWLWRVGADAYRRARNWLVAMTFPALVVFWLFPVSPPRSIPGAVGHDIVAEQHRYGWWGSGGGTAPRGFASLVNENAAMPSLHVGWALWVGWNLVHHAQHRAVRAFGYVYPAITVSVVLSTGNHYLLDVVAGTLLAVLAKLLVDALARRRQRRTVTAQHPRHPHHTARKVRDVDATRRPGRPGVARQRRRQADSRALSRTHGRAAS